MRSKFYSGLTRSFRAALRGVETALKEERTFRVMAACAILVFIAVCLFPLSTMERTLLLLVTAFILVLELMNTAVERFADLAKPRLSPYIRDVKDLMAAAVFIASCIAAAIAFLILGPHLLEALVI